MRIKLAILVGIVLLGVFLGGCLQPQDVNPVLVARFLDDTRLMVQFEVVGSNAARFVWDFGDGASLETTTAQVVHRYEAGGIYVVTVEGYGRGSNGDGGPGPGASNTDVLVFRLQTVVDTRKALEVIGIEVSPVDPPNWYAPGTPAWPENHFPANVALRFRLLTKVNRPGEIGVVHVDWKVFDAYGRLLEDQQAMEWVWYEAMTEFIVYGCPGGPTEYRVYVAVELSDGSVVQLTKSIWACPSNGCR